MNELDETRKEIRALDEEMAALFEKRMNLAKKNAFYKKEHGLSVYDPAREQENIEKLRTKIADPDIESYYVRFQKNVMDLSTRYQSRIINGIRVAYAGVEGAFAHIAAKRMFPEGVYEACPDFSEAYRKVEEGVYDCAVLPLENSYAGEVGAVTDLIFNGELYVNQVIDQPIVHNLLVLPGTKLSDIRKVVSHPQALSQCAEWLSRHGLASSPWENTALAAKYVKETGDKGLAAIASADTAELFGLEILEARINDSGNNTTRFASLSRVPNRPEKHALREDENFILMFTVQNKAGALAQTLNIIGSHGYNMRNLRSRPMKELQWNYYFYIEAEGNINNENGRDMLRELGALCARLKLVGVYFVSGERA